jgi:hypothetical protein
VLQAPQCITSIAAIRLQVAFGVCAILAADKGEAYGVKWTPSSTLDALQLPVTPGPRENCYWYKVGAAACVKGHTWF